MLALVFGQSRNRRVPWSAAPAATTLFSVGCERGCRFAASHGTRRIGLGGILVWLCLAAAMAPAAAAGVPTASLTQRLRTFRQSSRAVVGVSVRRVADGRVLFEDGATRLLIPASNQKILTSAFALQRLGRAFSFTTTVYRQGDDLALVGDFDPILGDPSLADAAGIYAELDRWAAAVRQKVGPRIQGDLLLRSARTTGEYRHPDWPAGQHRQWYVAPVAELNFHNNCFDVTFQVAGGSVSPQVRPESHLIRVLNRVRAGRRHIWSLRLGQEDSLVELLGTVKVSTRDPLSTAVDHPPLLLGRVLAARLQRAGVTLVGGVRVVPALPGGPAERTALTRTRTPLPKAMARTNKRSLNMAAECFFLRAGDGTWSGSAAVMSQTLAKHFGLKAEGLVVRDGGGLSRRNRVTAGGLTKVLVALAGRKDAEVFLASLPVAGMDGTLRRRMARGPCRGRIRAKTGYIAAVSCLSGYVLDPAAEPALAFSILVNNLRRGSHPAKKLQDDLCRLLVDSTDP